MTLLRTLVAGAALALAAAPAAAQTEQLKLTGTGTNVWDYPGSGATHVGPYQAQVLSQPGQPTIDIYCVDFQHQIRRNDVWNATFSNVMGDLSATRAGVAFGDATARSMYQQAAFLTTLYAGASVEQTRGIQSAIWDIFYTGAPDHAQTGYWRTYAAANYLTADIDYRGFAVVTDVNFRSGGKQEFLTTVDVPPTVNITPEPSTYLLMASGLLGLAGVAHRRRRQPLDG